MHVDVSGWELLRVGGPLVAALVLLSNARWLGERLGVIDHPDQVRKIHPRATPLIGGLAIMLPLLVWALAALIWPAIAGYGRAPVAILIGGGGATLLGFVDDRLSITAQGRFVALLALSVASLIICPQLLPTHFQWGDLAPTPVAPWLAYVLVTIGMTGFINAVNMADGQDGCVAGMFVIWSGCIMLVGDPSSVDVAAILFVTSLAVLSFNLRGKVFLGGAGAYGATFVFALLVLTLHNHTGVTGETVMVWFFIPVVDCLRLLVTRPLYGRSPFEADRNHLHHRLHDRFGKNEGLAIYLGLVGSTSLIAALFAFLALSCLITLSFCYIALMWMTAKAAVAAPAPALPPE